MKTISLLLCTISKNQIPPNATLHETRLGVIDL